MVSNLVVRWVRNLVIRWVRNLVIGWVRNLVIVLVNRWVGNLVNYFIGGTVKNIKLFLFEFADGLMIWFKTNRSSWYSDGLSTAVDDGWMGVRCSYFRSR